MLNNAAACHIQDPANYTAYEVICMLKNCHVYSLQLGESTDISGLGVLLVFFQYKYHYAIEDDFLLCECLQSTRTREEYSTAWTVLSQSMTLFWKNVLIYVLMVHRQWSEVWRELQCKSKMLHNNALYVMVFYKGKHLQVKEYQHIWYCAWWYSKNY